VPFRWNGWSLLCKLPRQLCCRPVTAFRSVPPPFKISARQEGNLAMAPQDRAAMIL